MGRHRRTRYPCRAMNHHPHPPIRIAIVEDDADLLLSTQEFLSAAGYQVWGASSAEIFFRRCAAEPVDIVLLDIGLPGEDCLSVAALLQANTRIAVIILSARDAIEDRLAGMRAGADRYLVKPVNLIELAANIDAVAKRLGIQAAPPTSAPVTPPAPVPALPPAQPSQNRYARRASDTPSAHQQRHWRLATQDWTLTAPEGSSLRLSAREFDLVHRLVMAQGQTVPKKELADAIFGPRVINGSERINVLLARLRKKAAQSLTQELPIKTAHQVGYAFTAPTQVCVQPKMQ